MSHRRANDSVLWRAPLLRRRPFDAAEDRPRGSAALHGMLDAGGRPADHRSPVTPSV
jgi:hypothetical protein